MGVVKLADYRPQLEVVEHRLADNGYRIARVTMKSTDAPIISTTKTPDFTTSKA